MLYHSQEQWEIASCNAFYDILDKKYLNFFVNLLNFTLMIRILLPINNVRKERVIIMRIDAYTAVSQMYNTSKTKKTQSFSQVGATDRFEISQVGKDLQTAKAAVAKAPDVREDVVADIKRRMENGSYNVSDEAFADVLLAKYFGA